MEISVSEQKKLFKQAKHQLGAPIRKIQLEDEQMLTLLEMATEDYVEFIQKYIIEHQWPALLGLNISESDLTRAFISRNFDALTQYTYSYSKIVGLGTGEGGWELKKDFITLNAGQQIYQIPANREINEIMWFTPPTLDQAIIDPFLGVWNNQFGAEYIGLGSYYIMPAYDILLRAADRNLKNRIVRSELTYRVTNGPNGTKYIHLMSTPGSRFDFRSTLVKQAKVWYWYYDTSVDKQRCLEENKDIIKSPADVPLENLDFNDLNNMAKIWVRRYFIALCKETLGRVRGTFNGKVPVPNTELTMDYQSLLTEGKDEQNVLRQELKDQLEVLHPTKVLERQANEAEQINRALKYRPFQKPYRVI